MRQISQFRYRLTSMLVSCGNLGADRRAVTAIEYALIAGIITVAIVGSFLRGVGPNLSNTFNSVSSSL